jgi:hypothetical protein
LVPLSRVLIDHRREHVVIAQRLNDEFSGFVAVLDQGGEAVVPVGGNLPRARMGEPLPRNPLILPIIQVWIMPYHPDTTSPVALFLHRTLALDVGEV